MISCLLSCTRNPFLEKGFTLKENISFVLEKTPFQKGEKKNFDSQPLESYQFMK